MINLEYIKSKFELEKKSLIKNYIFGNLLEVNIPLKEFVNDFEKQIIEYGLLITHGNQKRAAVLLGIKPTTINEKIKKYKILLNNYNNEKVNLTNYREILSLLYTNNQQSERSKNMDEDYQ
jgi:DNA-binding NtrC family response regulator